MGIFATKKACKELKKVLNFLKENGAENGGSISTDDPKTWWKLFVEIYDKSPEEKRVIIGESKSVNGDTICDPVFTLDITIKDADITEIRLMGYDTSSLFGSFSINENDYITGPWGCEKDDVGMKNRFSSFMNNVVNVGPYLSDPGKISAF